MARYGCLTLSLLLFGESEPPAAENERKPPAQYFCLGFKDRELEDEYLDDLARLSKDRLCLGYVVAFVGKGRNRSRLCYGLSRPSFFLGTHSLCTRP